jgi:hypothetical protein
MMAVPTAFKVPLLELLTFLERSIPTNNLFEDSFRKYG